MLINKKHLLHKQQILERKILVDKNKPADQANDPWIAGVYFLIEGKDIVYIGYSVDCYKRLRRHVLNDIFYFNYFYAVKIQEYEYVEKFYIRKFKPKYNRNGFGYKVSKPIFPKLLVQ
jgi:hypothetical protein